MTAALAIAAAGIAAVALGVLTYVVRELRKAAKAHQATFEELLRSRTFVSQLERKLAEASEHRGKLETALDLKEAEAHRERVGRQVAEKQREELVNELATCDPGAIGRRINAELDRLRSLPKAP